MQLLHVFLDLHISIVKHYHTMKKIWEIGPYLTLPTPQINK